MAGIKLDFPFSRTASEPIDGSFTLSKEEMLAVKDNEMPAVYFAVCKDDKQFYIYDKSATPNSETGKFSVLETGSTYTGGTGITITGTEISADTTVLAEKSELPDMTGYYTKTEVDALIPVVPEFATDEEIQNIVELVFGS